MTDQKALLELLRSLPGLTFEHELDFTRTVVPQLAAILGYSDGETFYELSKHRHRADVVLSSSIESKPWVVLELRRGHPRNIGDWVYQLKRYLKEFDADVAALVSPEVLIVVSPVETKRLDLSAITPEEAGDIFRLLSRGTRSAVRRQVPPGKLAKLVEDVEQATSNKSKGEALEALARHLADSVPSLRCKYTNLATRSSEIDLVVEYLASSERIPLFEELGRYSLIECKNWSKPVGVGPVRDFIGKLKKCRVQLGVLFSKNGVTGVDSGADALREIQSLFDREGIVVLVFSLEDMRDISGGRDFVAAIDRKADALRFDAENI